MRTGFFLLVLVGLGAGWGLTQPLTKIAVSTGYEPWGLIFWQMVIGSLLMAVLSTLRGRHLPLTWGALKISILIALMGTLVPNTASYRAIAHLPSGVISILLSLIPMMAFPIALALRLESFRPLRFLGLGCGLVGVLLLVLPEASLPDPAMLLWIPIALIAPACYAFEGNYVARWGTEGLDAIQVLYGASLVGAVLVLPFAVASDQFITPFQPWGAPEWALIGSSVIHVLVYAGYVWLVGQAGPVFAVQVSYLVTGFGVFWAMTLLGEAYSPYIWTALVIITAGVFLVQPRQRDHLALDEGDPDSAQRASGQ
ncbi:MAG: EamA family transporter [Rhodobacteraceae bacterium]|nr:EamA family transporter [Paracoccaceae bacterium]